MPRLVYRAAALRDLAEIAAYIERESGSRDAAEAFIDKLTAYLPVVMGRPRSELRPGHRSITHGSYVILLRYADEEGLRSHLFADHQDEGDG